MWGKAKKAMGFIECKDRHGIYFSCDTQWVSQKGKQLRGV
jgi:hypothetical protein